MTTPLQQLCAALDLLLVDSCRARDALQEIEADALLDRMAFAPVTDAELDAEDAGELAAPDTEGTVVAEHAVQLHQPIQLLTVLRRLVANRTVAELHDAFGAPGDWGYETALGAALSRLYRAPELPNELTEITPAQRRQVETDVWARSADIAASVMQRAASDPGRALAHFQALCDELRAQAG